MLVDETKLIAASDGKNFDILQVMHVNQDLTVARRLEWVVAKVTSSQSLGEVYVKIFYGNKFLGQFAVDVDETSTFDFGKTVRRVSSRLVALPGEPIRLVVNDFGGVLATEELHVYGSIMEMN